jgi:prephenate dehydrogenase
MNHPPSTNTANITINPMNVIPLFETVGIIGVGLIGGSLSLAMKDKNLCRHRIGFGRTLNTLNQALALNIVDEISTDLSLIAQCDLVVICTPVAQFETVLSSIKPYLKPTALITDVGSTKQDVVAVAKTIFGQGDHPDDIIKRFIPAHPIAGKAQHGPHAAQADLYLNKHVIMTPLAENRPDYIERLKQLWESVGAVISKLSPLQHDIVFSSVSHLPHLLAYALVAQIANSEDAQTKLSYAGGGFKDFTRIAASSPEMWRDIFFANKTALLNDLRIYQRVLGHLEVCLTTDNVSGLEQFISHAAQVRQAWKPS